MDSSAVFTNSIADPNNVPAMKRQVRFASTLYAALNRPTLKLEDIAKWHWQIATYMYRSYTRSGIYSVSINPKCIFLDGRNNVFGSTCVVPISNEKMRSDLLVARSILSVSEVMLENIDPSNYNNKMRVYSILAKYILYTSSNIEKSENMVASAFFAVENLCNLVDDSVIDDINKLTEISFKELTI